MLPSSPLTQVISRLSSLPCYPPMTLCFLTFPSPRPDQGLLPLRVIPPCSFVSILSPHQGQIETFPFQSFLHAPALPHSSYRRQIDSLFPIVYSSSHVSVLPSSPLLCRGQIEAFFHIRVIPPIPVPSFPFTAARSRLFSVFRFIFLPFPSPSPDQGFISLRVILPRFSASFLSLYRGQIEAFFPFVSFLPSSCSYSLSLT